VKGFITTAALLIGLVVPVVGFTQDKPGAIVGQEVEAIITVRAINHETRMVTIETPDGRRTTLEVPEEAHNLYQVNVGSRFKVRYREAVAIGVSTSGEAPSAEVEETAERAERGANPGGVITRTVRVSGRVERIDHQSRMVAIRGPQGKVREFTVSDEVQRLDQVEVGDLVQIVYAEALALEMIPQ
jgi:hypothetical protein